ncbi:MAG: DUF2752 domain-containing protein [Eubacteriales bacterium]
MKKITKHNALFIVTAHAAIALFVFAYTFFLGCPISHFFGVPCPSCGMTSAHLAFLRGDIREAFAYHPLFWLAIPLIFLFLHNNIFNFHISKKALNIIAIVSIVLFVSVYLIRIFILHDPVLKIDFDGSILHRILDGTGIVN